MLTAFRAALVSLCFIFLGSLAPVCAEELTIDGENPLERPFSSLENDSGFIVDRTITNFGANFFREFSLAWRDRVGDVARGACAGSAGSEQADKGKRGKGRNFHRNLGREE